MASYDDGVIRDYTSATALAANAASPLTTPTYDGSGQIAEIDVLHFPEGWNGWRYWMASGAYPGSNSGYENPALLVSQDGQTWQAPPGVTNPLDPTPAGGHNSDPSLFCDIDGTMFIYWIAGDAAGNAYLRYRSSTDGVTWTPTATIFEYLGSNGGDSPKVIYDPKLKVYRLYLHTLPSGNNREYLCYSEAGSVAALPYPQTIATGLGFQSPTPANWSHFNIQLWQGTYYMLYSDTSKLWLCTSLDGKAWTVSSPAVLGAGQPGAWDAGGIYRTAFVIAQTVNGPAIDLWYASHSGASPDVWRVGYSRMHLGATSLNQTHQTLTGTTAGIAAVSQPFRGAAYKKVVVYLGGYNNTTATAQTITFPRAFTHTPYLARDDSGGATVTADTLTLPASMAAAKTGWIVVEGF
jgi:hypothetical protein